jgi:hypothetical protein
MTLARRSHNATQLVQAQAHAQSQSSQSVECSHTHSGGAGSGSGPRAGVGGSALRLADHNHDHEEEGEGGAELQHHNVFDYGKWFIWCQNCKHGGHASCIDSWFRLHEVCGVHGCECSCRRDQHQRGGRARDRIASSSSSS